MVNVLIRAAGWVLVFFVMGPNETATWAATAPIKAAFTSTPAPAPTPRRTPAAVSNYAPASFVPGDFGRITSESLPMEKGQPIVARVNGYSISWNDYIAQVHLTGARLYQQFPDQEDGIAAALAGPIMETLILQELYRQFAADRALSVHPTEVKARVAKLIQGDSLSTGTKVITTDDYERAALNILIQEKVNKYLGDAATSTPPTQAEITSFTSEMKPTTSSVEITRARHIVFRATPDMGEFAINDAKAKAEEVLQKIRDGLDFYQAARQYSQDRFTAYMGGNIGYYKPGSMYPAFEEAAKSLKVGEISDVVRTPVGFHIIQITERQPDDMLLQVDAYRKTAAVFQWKTEINRTVKVENYLAK